MSRGSKAVYTVVDRPTGRLWLRIGWARLEPDGSMTVSLDALPLNGQLLIRSWSPSDTPDAAPQSEEKGR